MQLLQWQTKDTKNSVNCSICGQYHLKGCLRTFTEERKNDGNSYILNCTRIFPPLSASSTMSQNQNPAILYQYQRRKQHRNSSAVTKPTDVCHSAISSEAHSEAPQGNMVSVPEHEAKAIRSFDGCRAMKEAGSEKTSRSAADRVLNLCPVNDSCSSSKSNLELSSASLKTSTDDAGDCSSSAAATSEKVTNGMSERDICISIFRSQGLLSGVLPRQDSSSEDADLVNDLYCSKSCKVCEKLENSSKLLICDNCEDAFHRFCCNPHVKRIPVGEWLCKSCLMKKHKILNEKFTSNGTEVERNGTASEDELGSLEFMFTDTEPYISNVRIGDEFQADVPYWSTPIHEESDLIGRPLKTDPSNSVDMQEGNSTKSLQLNSIGNWLQCQQIIEGTGQDLDETICGKWRRAPLFEVQTDNWECFRCVLWNPAQADCSVPQELETVEVMRQLKYMEMLGPRAAAKRRKLNSLKNNGSQNQSQS